MREIPGTCFHSPEVPHLAVGIGNFDGVHLGHQALLRRLGEVARNCGAPAAVLTFRPHPAQFLRPAEAAPLICDVEDERALLAACGVDLLIEEPFTAELALLSPAQFVQQILQERLRARHVVVGANFRFGARAAGTAELLRSLGTAAGMQVEVIAPVTLGGSPVSSSRIRGALLQGRVEEAEQLLGHPFLLSGTVVRGAGRGRQLGFPTVNIERTTPLLPAFGVYAARARLAGVPEGLAAGVCIGVRPTFGVQSMTIEAHLLDFHGDLYGRRVSLELLAHLRPERRFDSREELIDALHDDLTRTRAVLEERAHAAAAPIEPRPAER